MSNSKNLARMLMVAGGLAVAATSAPAAADVPCGPRLTANPCAAKKKTKKVAKCAAAPCAA